MKHLIVAAGLTLLTTAPAPPALANTAAPSPARAPSPTVRKVAANPGAHLGPLTLSGVVGIVTPGKGFVLVDLMEYQEEGFECLTRDEPTKIPVRWADAAPKVKDKIRVVGELMKEKDGYAFVAKKVTRE